MYKKPNFCHRRFFTIADFTIQLLELAFFSKDALGTQN
jgi:hypothetical protein